MKLSNNKVYKRKGINNSRKKYKKSKGRSNKQHYKSKRKHPKTHNIKRKTLKIYVSEGGSSPDVSNNNNIPNTQEEIKDESVTSIYDACKQVKSIDKSIDNSMTIITVQNTVKESFNNTNLNELEESSIGDKKFKIFKIIGNGDCLYEAIVTGMFHKNIGDYTEAIQIGWVPKAKKSYASKLPSYIGNLRDVLANYICNNIKEQSFVDILGAQQLNETIKRILSKNIDEGASITGWGEDPELRLMARLFKICIAVYIPTRDNITQYYNSNGDFIIENIEDEIKKCNDNILYIINKDGQTHYDLLIPNTDDPSKEPTEPESPGQNAETLNSQQNCDISRYNSIVPDNIEDAEKKFAELYNINLPDNCNEDVKNQLLIIQMTYKELFTEKYGKEPTQQGISALDDISNNTFNYSTDADDGSVNDCDKLFEGDMDFNNVPDDIENALQKYESLTKIRIDDKSYYDNGCSKAILNALKVYTDNFISKFPNILSTPFTNTELINIYKIYTNNESVPFSRKILAKLITDEYLTGKRLRTLIGYPIDMKQKDLTTGLPANYLFASIINSINVVDENNISLDEFINFITCGTHRDQTKPDVNCNNVRSPSDPSGEPSSPSGEPSRNIEVAINETKYNDNESLKQVDISIIVPNDSRVVIRNYAAPTNKDTVSQLTTYGLNGNQLV